MKLAVITDIHVSNVPDPAAPQRRGDQGLLLLNLAIDRITRCIQPDLTVILGDVVEDADAPEAREHLTAVRALLDQLESPTLVLPGNHDGDARLFDEILGPTPQTLDINGVRFITFRDATAPNWNATRSTRDLDRSRHASDHWAGPVVALQHVPVFLPGTAACLYNLTNADQAIEAMAQGGVTLALAGHAHSGMPLTRCGSVHCAVTPALCEPPFQFQVIDIDTAGHTHPRITPHQVALPQSSSAAKATP